MAGVHGVHGVDDAGAADKAAAEMGANYEDPQSGDVFGISSEWVDGEGNIKSSGVHGDTHGGQLGQQGSEFGDLLNTNEIAEAAKAMGMSEQDISNFVDKFTSNENNFNPGQTDDQKKVGAALALNEMIAAENVNQLGLSEDEVRQVSADAVKAAKAGKESGDASELRSVLEGAGGNTGNLTDQQLLNVWTSNPHENNHAILNVDEGPFKLTHLRSIGTEDAPEGAGLAYSNDKQQYPERGDAIAKANSALEEYDLFRRSSPGGSRH
jgi:hypothetical protein